MREHKILRAIAEIQFVIFEIIIWIFTPPEDTLISIFNVDNKNLRSWDLCNIHTVRHNRGWLLTVIKIFFFAFSVYSPLIIYKVIFSRLGRKRDWLEKKWFVEFYVLSWFLFELVILSTIEPPFSCKAVITFFLAWRVIDIIQSQFSASFLRRLPSDNIPARSLIIVLINYVEMVLIFASIYFLNYQCIDEITGTTIFTDRWKSLSVLSPSG